MNRRNLMLALAASFAAAMCFGQGLNIGTWKLNEAKSHFVPGAPKNTMVVYEAVGDNVKVTMEGIDKDGKPTHTEWTGKFDGKEYPVSGNPAIDSRSYTKVDDHTLTTTNKKNGKEVLSARIVISPDGKTRTAHVTETDSAGKKHTYTAVYDKQ